MEECGIQAGQRREDEDQCLLLHLSCIFEIYTSGATHVCTLQLVDVYMNLCTYKRPPVYVPYRIMYLNGKY